MKTLNKHKSQNNLHFAFLFSSPLVRILNNEMQNIMQLSCISELDDIYKSVVGNLDYNLRFKSCVATRENFRSIICDWPSVLHFSGHGIENTLQNIGDDYLFNSDKGDILLLENESGMSDYYYKNELMTLLEIWKYKFEVVFVSSCHSQFAGQVFLESGAKHVICIKQDEKILDKASLLFSKVFYETLFTKKYSVCDAYKTARKEVGETFSKSEANKFMLKIQEDEFRHKCKGLTNLERGEFKNLTEKPLFDYVPSSIDGFIDRQREMYEIIKLLHENRVVSILGPPGIGKTSISRSLSNYLRDRKKFKDGIIYVRLRGCESAQMFLSRLSLILLTLCKEQNEKPSDDLMSEGPKVEHSEEDDEETAEDLILRNLKDKDVLLILDNAEDPLTNDQIKFSMTLESIIDFCTKTRILVTSRTPLNMVGNNLEKIYRLEPMPKDSALKLLISKAPRRISNDEIKELLHCDIPRDSKLGQSLNFRFNMRRGDELKLVDHPFAILLGGHPQAISLAAPMLKDKTLKNLFLAFCKTNLMDVIDDSINIKTAQTSLRVSLELSIQRVNEIKPKALDFFGLIGLLPGGVSNEELFELWGDDTWEPLKEELIGASLLTYKAEDNGSFIYSMLPFMSVRAHEHLDKAPDTKQDYHKKLWKLFKNYCAEFYYCPQKERESVEIKEALVNIETNIWAWIYRALNLTKNIEYQDFNGTSTHKEDNLEFYETRGQDGKEDSNFLTNSNPDYSIAYTIFNTDIKRSVEASGMINELFSVQS